MTIEVLNNGILGLEFRSKLNANFSSLQTDINNKPDTVDITNAVNSAALTINNRIDSEVIDLESSIAALANTVSSADTAVALALNNRINTEVLALQNADTALAATLNTRITNEVIDLDADILSINNRMGGITFVKLTQAAYNAIVTPNSNTMYLIVG